MSNRITQRDLEGLADTLNKVTDSPIAPYSNGKANVGNYHISYAYGGACLHRMANEHGGVTCPIQNHHSPKRELYNAMHAYLSGLLE